MIDSGFGASHALGLCLALLFAACADGQEATGDGDAGANPDLGLRDAGTVETQDAAGSDRGLEEDGGSPDPDGGQEPADAQSSLPDAGEASCLFPANLSVPRFDPRLALGSERLDALQDCIAREPARAAELVDGFLEEVERFGSSAPLIGQGEALVLYRGDATGLSVSGSFDGWPSPGLRQFQTVPGSDLHVARVPLARGERHEYKLTRVHPGGGVEWLTDPLNRWIRWDGIDLQGVGNFNNELVGPDYVPTRSLLARLFIRDREVYLLLPSEHFDASRLLPVLYVHDGNEMLTRAGMQTVVDQTFAQGRAEPVAVAFVGLARQEDRLGEYTFGPGTGGDAYITFLVDEVVPQVESLLDHDPDPSRRGLAGASLGGLISFHGAFSRSDVFGLVGAQSASLWWNDSEMISRVENGPLLPIRVYLDCGTGEGNLDVNTQMADVLALRGYDHLAVFEPGAEHDWAFWTGRFDELLEFLY